MAAKKTESPEVTTTPEVTTETVPTPAGDARITWHHAPGAHALLAASHGAGGASRHVICARWPGRCPAAG
ncbi:hypothetical protein SANT12839_062500 [Streptomyces antimycoticus]|uniref:Hydrolase n=1 Tax=Streptomyces antimycoticus TaxID=68175 RepID=A0A4D4KFK2_9ACTN|nr:hypothetical protein SANT12839_062500 [Streptomyces antimycoticus]